MTNETHKIPSADSFSAVNYADAGKILEGAGGFAKIQGCTKQKEAVERYVVTMKEWCKSENDGSECFSAVALATAGCRLVDCRSVWNGMRDTDSNQQQTPGRHWGTNLVPGLFFNPTAFNLRTLPGTEEALYEYIDVMNQIGQHGGIGMMSMGGASAQVAIDLGDPTAGGVPNGVKTVHSSQENEMNLESRKRQPR